MERRYVTRAEAELLDDLDELPSFSTAMFAARLSVAIRDGDPHPLTSAAAFVEGASFETPVERGEIAAPAPAEF